MCLERLIQVEHPYRSPILTAKRLKPRLHRSVHLTTTNHKWCGRMSTPPPPPPHNDDDDHKLTTTAQDPNDGSNNNNNNNHNHDGKSPHSSSGEENRASPLKPVPPLSAAANHSSVLPTLVLCGLDNLGFTCYVNSCIQLLYSTARVRQHLLRTIPLGTYHSLVGRLFHQMATESRRSLALYGRTAVVAPRDLITEFRARRPEFTPGEHDAHEFLTILVELIHQEENRVRPRPPPPPPQSHKSHKSRPQPPMPEPRSARESWRLHRTYSDWSALSRMFLGQCESALRCSVCGRASVSWTAFWQLSLDLIDWATESEEASLNHELSPLTLQQCIRRFEAEESVGNLTCSVCGQPTPHTKGQTVCRAPHYLLLQLKRFGFTGEKVHRKVEITGHVTVCDTRYALCTVVVHRGSNEQTGHYLTVLRHRRRWIVFDDEKVVVFAGQTADEAPRMLAQGGYICLYRTVSGRTRDQPNDETNDEEEEEEEQEVIAEFDTRR